MLPNISPVAPLPAQQPANDTGLGPTAVALGMRRQASPLLAAVWPAPLPQNEPARPPYQSRLAPWQLRRVTEFMRANLAETLQLSQLAAISGLSTSHFGRAFKGSTGLPPHRWHLNLRIDQARTMLTEAGASLADVACATGFADQSHFTRVFSKIVGISPGAWRRSRIA